MKKVATVQRRTRGRPRSVDRETVLAAAMELVDSDLSLPELAEALGVNLAAIYRIFGDKAGLYIAMYVEALKNLDKIEGATWTAWLNSFVKALLKLVEQYPFVIGLQSSLKSRYSDVVHQLAGQSLAMVTPGIELLVKAGLDRNTAHHALMGIQAIVYEHALTKQIYSEVSVVPAGLEPLDSAGDDRVWLLLKIICTGLQAEMKASKGR